MNEQEKIKEFVKLNKSGDCLECSSKCSDWSHFGDGPCGYVSEDPQWHYNMQELAEYRTDMLQEKLDEDIKAAGGFYAYYGFIDPCTRPLTYYEKLKDPRWQKKRLEIFERDNFTCTRCGDETSPLVVHHKKYTHGEPWDIDNSYLITLCEECHQITHKK